MLAPPSWRSSDRRSSGRDEGVDRVRLALQLGNIMHQMPRPWVARARAVQPRLEGEPTRRQLTIELLAPAKFRRECPSNGRRVLLGRDVGERMRARGIRSRERGRRQRVGLVLPTCR